MDYELYVTLTAAYFTVNIVNGLFYQSRWKIRDLKYFRKVNKERIAEGLSPYATRDEMDRDRMNGLLASITETPKPKKIKPKVD